MKRLAILLALLCLPLVLTAQEERTFQLPLFTEGLSTRYSANVIPDSALTEATNVVLDEDITGVVVARNGRSKYNTTAFPNGKTVRGLWPFDASDGTKYMVAQSSSSFFYTSGDGVWHQITSADMSLTDDFNCTQALGKLWCVNGKTTFTWDGISTSAVAGMPLGTLIDRFRNRIVVSGIAGSQSRIRLSGELDGTDFVFGAGLSTSPANISVGGADDGLAVTCLMGVYQDTLVIGKRDSLWGLYGFGQTDFSLRELSREVGCIDNRTVREKNGCLYWLSKRGMEKFCGTSIERISDPIRNLIDNIIATAGNSRSATDSSQADFEAGNLLASGAGAPVSSTIWPGNVAVSSVNVILSSTQFSAGTHGGTGVSRSGNLEYNVITSTYLYRYDGSVLPTNDGWTQFNPGGTAGTQSVSGGTLTLTLLAGRFADPAIKDYRTWSISTNTVVYNFRSKVGGGAGCADLSNIHINFTSKSSAWGCVSLYRDGSIIYDGACQGTAGNNYLTETTGALAYSTFTVALSTRTDANPAAWFWRNGIFIGSVTYTNIPGQDFSQFTANINLGGNCISGGNFYGWIDFINIDADSPFPSLGNILSVSTFTSTIYDTTFSTPVYGPITISSTMPSGTGLGFQVRASSSPNNDLWTSYESFNNGFRPTTIDGKRYVQFKSTFSHYALVESPGVSFVDIAVETTGYFISQCRNPSTAITKWGNFQCNETTTGNGSITYWISTGTSCNEVTSTTANWQSQPNNAGISVATAPYVAYRALFNIDSATQTAAIRDCTINWIEGETRPPAASSVYRDRFYLAYSSSTAQGAHNDHILVLDKNDKWTLFDSHNCYSLSLYERKLYCGNSNADGFVWMMDSGQDDGGNPIVSSIKTKAFSFGAPEMRKTYQKLYLEMEPAPSSDYNIDLNIGYNLDSGDTTYTLNTLNLSEDPGHIQLGDFPFPAASENSSRYIQFKITSDGKNQPWRLYGGKLYYNTLRKE